MASYEAEPDERSDAEWLEDLFVYEYCAECSGDAVHHLVVSGYPLPGSRFALCLSTPIVDDHDAVLAELLAYGPKGGDA